MSGLAVAGPRQPHHLLQPVPYHRRVRQQNEVEELVEAPVPAPTYAPIVERP
jgi:hypothetical protein